MVDFVPFPGMASTDNNTQYPANQVMITGNSGTVTASGSMIIVPSTGNIGIGTTNPTAKFDVNVAAIFRQNVTVLGNLTGTLTIAGNVNITNTTPSTASTNGAIVIAGGVGIGGNINVGGSKSTFTNSIGVGTSGGAGMYTGTPNAFVWGNVVIANSATTGSGIIFPDGTRQTTAANLGFSYGNIGTIQLAGAGNTFAGDSSQFVYDNTNKRVGIGTSTPAYLFSLYGTDYVLFNNRPGSAARQEITVGNVIGYGSVLGYDPSIGQSIGYLRRGDSAATAPAITWAYVSSNYRVGINAITQPQNTMDIAGAVAIGSNYSGFGVMTNTNGLSVQGQVGIGTFTPSAQVDILANNSTGSTPSHILMRNGTGSQTVIGYQFGATVLATNRVDNSGNWVVSSSANKFYFNNDAVNTGTAGTANFWNNANFMNTVGAAVTFPGAASTVSVTANTMVVTGGYSDSALKVQTANAYGGAGYAGIQTWTNNVTGSTNINKYWRLNSTGGIEIINSAYTAVRFTFTDGGAFSASGEVTAYSSDGRLKENVQTIPDALQKTLRLRGVTFDWKPAVNDLGFQPTRVHDVGVIAQEVQAVLPEAVRPAPFDIDINDSTGSKSGENYLTVQYEKLTALLIEAIKEQQKKIDDLEARLSFLELDP